MKVLIANRGEIAVRIIRACQEMAIETVAVYSTVDKESLHVQLADEAYCIGKGPAIESYLNIPAILTVAILSHATAIHPGFGFLSENEEFAKACEACHLTFIGPKAETIALMGDKIKARQTMQKLDVPVIPGSDGEVQTVKEALILAEKLGFPIMIKAKAGGGGKGMRKVFSKEALTQAFQQAQKEAQQAFGEKGLYLEKIIYPAKHIEVQIIGDGKGKVWHFGERDCSLQRKHQKVLEEAPATSLSSLTQDKIRQYALKAAKGVCYLSCGTIEFLVDQTNHIYFMEMNTRIQVEHAITEMITGYDLIKLQLQLAQGETLDLIQEEILFHGVSLECRLNAEDPKRNFLPQIGTLHSLFFPQGTIGLRVDAGVYEGYTLSPYYDSMIAKIITHGKTREEAIMKMQRALNELVIEGIQTTQELQLDLITDETYIQNEFDTAFLEENFLPRWLEKNNKGGH